MYLIRSERQREKLASFGVSYSAFFGALLIMTKLINFQRISHGCGLWRKNLFIVHGHLMSPPNRYVSTNDYDDNLTMWSHFFWLSPSLTINIYLINAHTLQTNWIAMEQSIDSDWVLPIEATHSINKQLQGYAQLNLTKYLDCVHDRSVQCRLL